MKQLLRSLPHVLQQANRLSDVRRMSRTYSVYMWGSGDHGQLGLGSIHKSGMIMRTYKELSPRPLPSIGDCEIADMSCGLDHTLAVTSEGKVFAWGNPKYGKLGLGAETSGDVLVPAEVDAFGGVPIVSVVCGENHSAAVDEKGRLWTWGYGGGSWLSGGGMLGHGNENQLDTPKLVESLVEEGVTVKTVCCGELHTSILTDDGEVMSCGAGEYGRLGNGNTYDVNIFEPLEYIADEEVTKLVSGHAFSLALTKDGVIYCWGRNDQGQLGMGATLSLDVYSMEADPNLIEAFHNLEIKEIAAGHSHAAALTSDGVLYMWGMKNYLEPQVFKVMKNDGSDGSEPEEATIRSLACGMNFTCVLSDEGDLFTFGKGGSNCLGHGDGKYRAQPELVRDISNVAFVRSSHRHIAAFVEK
uniref:RCC1-like domain-containing protein n=1 Tax=Octactis speculum TaxID=3111310 RepID=A0A7S2AQB8_9STRA|mmetsp:Transcript_13975/g.18586  ORF Transcript_13975/g.18586 Transcript_13975/m.18586 type:complete len:414 (+) Transcript_13975:26-1267(+)